MNQNQDQDTRGQKLADCGLLMASPRVGASRPARSAKTVWEAEKWARNDDARSRLIVANVPGVVWLGGRSECRTVRGGVPLVVVSVYAFGETISASSAIERMMAICCKPSNEHTTAIILMER